MRLHKALMIVIGLSALLSARNIHNIDYQHPRSEPQGLYIVGFNYAGYFYQYRIYCPSATVREITNGSWGTARKAYQEDRRNFRNVRVVREAVDYVCGY